MAAQRMSPEQGGLSIYSTIFDQHVEETQRHLQGAALGGSPKELLPPAPVIGSVLWSPTEMDAFFHALTVHSRFRLELIAACVKTKNVLEVVEYLNALDEGSQRHKPEHSYGRDLPPAREMSKEWIAWEEKHAELLHADKSSRGTTTLQARAPRQRKHQQTADGGENAGNFALKPGESTERELSPISRRRLQKRMSMRRRRARERGEVVNTTLSPLKVGRPSKVTRTPNSKPKPKPKSNISIHPPNKSLGANNMVSQPCGQMSANTEPGMNIIPVISGVAGTLDERSAPSGGQMLINLPNLRNFLRFHTGLYDKRLLNGNEDVDTRVIDALVIMTGDFVGDIIGRAVILSEERKKMKGSIKVWRQEVGESDTDIIKQSITQTVLESMNFGVKTRKECLRNFLSSLDMPTGNGVAAASPESDEELTLPVHPFPLPRIVSPSEKEDGLFDDDSVDFQNDRTLNQEDSLADQVSEALLRNRAKLE
ncbi:hypothetical protein P691DRAFT_771543 [Macrolepiota fuliginosa MF-IS2]|uniref:Uncharacterized protein n=1 Tax=Macrolepiota fuliginosa MF-IS2 TaxID=1400762 RepID=A0A9P5XL28_9AGAR|nr:hypothetical protein P691DRAFT_771543 [Macrolepiota fuliginosa MF-IS2]